MSPGYEKLLPDLPKRFADALDRAVEFIFSEFEPIGILASGTIIRGEAHANSDLDLYVIHLAPYRRRVQRFFDDVPAEIFVNPPTAVRRYFEAEDRDGHRFTAHMLATGVIVFQASSIIDELRTEAHQWLAKTTVMPDSERVRARYAIASRLEDALDVADSDEVTMAMILAEVVKSILEYVCKASSGQIPRQKDLLSAVAAKQPEVAELGAAFFRAETPQERWRIAVRLADLTIGAHGFFPWDSGPDPAPT